VGNKQHFGNAKRPIRFVSPLCNRISLVWLWRNWLPILLFFCEWGTSATAQSFKINPVTVSNGAVVINFPTRSDSYYLLQATPTLNSTSSPVNAILGNGGLLGFNPASSQTGSMFYRVEQLPLTSPNSLQNDGIPDAWKLQQGLNPLTPGVVTNLANGCSTTWLQVYMQQTNLQSLPVAFFPNPNSTVVVGLTNVSIPVALTKPYTGFLTYQLSGTAVPQSSGVTGDYVPTSGKVFVANSTTANISITLVPETDIEINRSIVMAISAPPVASQTYAIATN
jgi:hypothetical protein